MWFFVAYSYGSTTFVVFLPSVHHVFNAFTDKTIVAIVFSAIHLQFYGFVPRMLIGVWLGYLFVWPRSLWVPIAAHALNNSMVVIFSWLTDTHRMTLDIDHVGVPTDGQWPWLALASALGWVALAMMARRMFFGKAPEASRME